MISFAKPGVVLAFLVSSAALVAAPSPYDRERAERGAAAVAAFERGEAFASIQRFYLFTLKREVGADEILDAVGKSGARLTALHVCPDVVGVMAFYIDPGTSRQQIEDLPRQAVDALRAGRSALGASAGLGASGRMSTNAPLLPKVNGFCGLEATGSAQSLRALREAMITVTFAIELTEPRFRLLPMNMMGR